MIWLALLLNTGLAHEGGHGTPADPIADLPKITTTKGVSYGIDAAWDAGKLSVSLVDGDGQPADPAKIGLADSATGEVKAKGKTKALKFKREGVAYVADAGPAPEDGSARVKIVFSEGKRKLTAVIEGAGGHSHGDEHSHHH